MPFRRKSASTLWNHGAGFVAVKEGRARAGEAAAAWSAGDDITGWLEKDDPGSPVVKARGRCEVIREADHLILTLLGLVKQLHTDVRTEL